MADITSEQIVAAVSKYISDNLTVSTTVIYPGTWKDTGSINDWIELWVNRVRQKIRRRNNKDHHDVTVEVVCWAKRTTSIFRIMDMVKDVADQLEHAEISIKNYNLSGTPEVGYLRVGEPIRRDTTRDTNQSAQTNLRTMTLEFPASAQEL